MILCVGTTPVFQRSMIFERLRLDAVNRAVEVNEYASGKGINVARVAHTLGEEVVVTGFLGGDSGQFIRDELSASKIPHDFVSVAAKTRTCVTVIDRNRDEVTELVEESKPVEPEAWTQLAAKIDQLLARATMMVLSGSLPPHSPEDFYKQCIEKAHDRGVRTIVDASGRPLMHAVTARPMIVKPNRIELGKTLGTEHSPLSETMRMLIETGAEWALVTEGKTGATVSNGKAMWHIASPQVKTVNPIGSGDAVAAGLAVAITRGQTMSDACRLAIACGAANAMTLKAGTVRPEDVADLTGKVELKSC